MMKHPVALAAALTLLAAAPALAQTPAASQDRTFVHEAAVGGLAEVAEGQLAVAQATSPGVKQFGQHMIDDHTSNNQALAALARQKGFKVPTEPDARHRQELAMLQRQPGAAFDRAYVKAQIAGHRQMEQAMQTEISSGTDPDLKAFAQKTLPTVQQHLQMAQQLQAKG